MRVLQETQELDRIQSHTAPYINERIRREIDGSVAFYATQGKEAIYRRLQELDREWDVDRALMANFAVLGSLTLALGLKKKKGFLYLFGTQMAFLFIHAAYGWCPPAPVFRRMRFRTHREIELERQQLRALLQEESGELSGRSR